MSAPNPSSKETPPPCRCSEPNVPKPVLSISPGATTRTIPQTPETHGGAGTEGSAGHGAAFSLAPAGHRARPVLAQQFPLLGILSPTHRQHAGQPGEEGWKEINRAQTSHSPSCFCRRGQRDRKRKHFRYFLWISFRPTNYFRRPRCSTLKAPAQWYGWDRESRRANRAPAPVGGVASAPDSASSSSRGSPPLERRCPQPSLTNALFVVLQQLSLAAAASAVLVLLQLYQEISAFAVRSAPTAWIPVVGLEGGGTLCVTVPLAVCAAGTRIPRRGSQLPRFVFPGTLANTSIPPTSATPQG